MFDNESLEKFMRESNFIEGEKIVANPCDSAFEPMIIGKLHDNDLAGAQFILGAHSIGLLEICETHRILFQNRPLYGKKTKKEWWGKLRSHDVEVGGYSPPHYTEVPALMEKFINNWGNMDAFTVHNENMNIHEFSDGNGRIGRLLWLRKHAEDGHDWVLDRGFLHNYYYETLRHQNSRSVIVNETHGI